MGISKAAELVSWKHCGTEELLYCLKLWPFRLRPHQCLSAVSWSMVSAQGPSRKCQALQDAGWGSPTITAIRQDSLCSISILVAQSRQGKVAWLSLAASGGEPVLWFLCPIVLFKCLLVEGEEDLGAWRERRCEFSVVLTVRKPLWAVVGKRKGSALGCIWWAPGKKGDFLAFVFPPSFLLLCICLIFWEAVVIGMSICDGRWYSEGGVSKRGGCYMVFRREWPSLIFCLVFQWRSARELIRLDSLGGDLLTLLTAGWLKLCLQSFAGQYEFALLMPTAESELSLFSNTVLSCASEYISPSLALC